MSIASRIVMLTNVVNSQWFGTNGDKAIALSISRMPSTATASRDPGRSSTHPAARAR
jgi:hypothetical protein